MTLKEFLNEKCRPPFAVLSHTWGANIDEVTLEDLNKYHELGPAHPTSVAIASKPGYKKIEGCCYQALCDGYDWAWVDTCCIDKASSAELSEAINSMFSWYKRSGVCYAYLSDVDAREEIFSPMSGFRESRWFKRGWTLQEVLAPGRVFFFDRGWSPIGILSPNSKLLRLVSEITSIPPAFLEGADLREATVAMRMSWASHRVTTRIEDMAYCLLGIFGVNMPLLYGEGMGAFTRLQEEIMRSTYDHTLLAWGFLPWDEGYSVWDTRSHSVLASSPADFAGSGRLIRFPRPTDDTLSDNYEMTSQGLRVQLPIWITLDPSDSSHFIYMAILDCFSGQDPSRRIAIPLKSPAERDQIRWQKHPVGSYEQAFNYLHGSSSEIFERTGRCLFFSEASPAYIPIGSRYLTKTIVLRTNTRASRANTFSPFAIIDFPQHYSCRVRYSNPYLEVGINRHTVQSSLQITMRPRMYHEDSSLGVFSTTLRPQPIIALAAGMMMAVRRLVSRPRVRAGDVLASLQFTKLEHTAPSTGAISFIAVLVNLPMPSYPHRLPRAQYLVPQLRLIPQLEGQQAMLATHPSGLSGMIELYESLNLGSDTIAAYAFAMPYGGLQSGRSHQVLLKIDTRDRGFLKARRSNALLSWHPRHLILILCYGLLVNILLPAISASTQQFYLNIWVLCFMPLLYQPARSTHLGGPLANRGQNVDCWIILCLGLALSIYPALRSVFGWPVAFHSSG